ncbi:hypothetical protein M601_017260 [Cellulophaga baltica 4]|nr:hypothetical protein M601_017260 [Cellulophaga baltica 4]
MKNMIKTFLVIAVFGSYNSYAEISKAEKDALIDLYTQTDGQGWNTTWDLNSPVSNWHGVTVKNDQVIKVNLFHNNLSGVLPASIGALKNLTELNLAFNQLTGGIACRN